MFCEGSERKEAFLDHSNVGLKKQQKCMFFKGVLASPWVCPKSGDFLIFSFYAKWIKKKVFCEGSERKGSLDPKNIG